MLYFIIQVDIKIESKNYFDSKVDTYVIHS